MSLLVKINQSDNVAIAVQPLSAGSEVEGIHINQDIPQAHKVALADIPKGSPVIRYGVILGYAMNPIKRGDWINEFMLELPTPPSVDDMEFGKNIVTDLPEPAGNYLRRICKSRRRLRRNQKHPRDQHHRTVRNRSTECRSKENERRTSSKISKRRRHRPDQPRIRLRRCHQRT